MSSCLASGDDVIKEDAGKQMEDADQRRDDEEKPQKEDVAEGGLLSKWFSSYKDNALSYRGPFHKASSQ